MPTTVRVPVKDLIIELAELEDDARRLRAASSTGADPVAFERELRRISSQEDQVVAALHELRG